MPMPNIAILLAAGQSQRMGTPKALYPLGNGYTFLSLLVNTCRAAGMAPLVVTGAHDSDIARAYPRLFRVYNRNWRDGQFSSVLCGLRACANAERILIHPVDAPHVSAQTLKALRDCGEPVAVANFQGTPGHPVSLDAPTARALLSRREETLETALKHFHAVPIAVDDRYVLENINTPAQLEKQSANQVPRRKLKPRK